MKLPGLCEKVEADVTEVAQGIGLDSRIGPRFPSTQALVGEGAATLKIRRRC